MKRAVRALMMTVALFSLLATTASSDEFLEGLQPDQVVHGFKTLNLYDNASGQAMGGRFISEKHGFIVDLLQIESVPQAFYWIKTPITGSRGEPHACEHLLLGKGNRGRYVAALEDMALGNSTAYTAQYRTCYHFNTTAGDKTFYDIFEAKLQALLHPDFTDEEIQREVCHIGVIEDPVTGELSLDEKGTVYTEMVSSFERPYYHTYGPLFQLVYGEDHPFTHTAGGDPDVMRSMVPQDMWDFHAATHHLANMGSIVSIPTDVPVESFLTQMSEMLDRCESEPDSSPLSGIGAYDFPPPSPAPQGTTKLVTYPSERTEDPGYLIYSWPADLDLTYLEQGVLTLFLDNLAGDETTDLYRLFVNSETRQTDIGATSVGSWIEDDFGNPIAFSLSGITSSLINEELVDSVGRMIVAEIYRIAGFEDGSPELTDFNNRARSRVIEWRKSIENQLNQPPMFGFRRGPAGAWLNNMENLEKIPGFRKSLTFDGMLSYADSLLNLDRNIWAERVGTWRLLDVKPYAVGATPSPDIVAANATAKEARITGYISDFKQKYRVDDDQAAIAAYKADFDAKTAELENGAAEIDLPGFIDNPPMTADDQLDYQTLMLIDQIPMVASTFENMTSSRVGLALRLDAIPESLLVYVPFLASVFTDLGVVKDGEIIRNDEMQERLRREVLNFNASFSFGLENDRVEVVLRGEGGNLEELQAAIGWMESALYSPYLDLDNLSRMQDVVDQALYGNRNRMRGSEESWVNSPANGYQYQTNPLIMSSACFLTVTHHLQRLRWMLTDPGSQTDGENLTAFLGQLRDTGTVLNREELTGMLVALQATPDEATANSYPELTERLEAFEGTTREIADKIVSAFKATLADIPDENLSDDWKYLCNSTVNDLLKKPGTTLAELQGVLDLIKRKDNARLFMISNTGDRVASLPLVENLLAKLSSAPTSRIAYGPVERVNQRLASRHPGLTRPLYAGLLHQGTQNGVLIFRAAKTEVYDTTTSAVLSALSGKLYGGGGPHGLFMKTWAAGLAYSNGYGFRERSGLLSYYAERCPDVAETMRFVVNEMKTAEPEPQLVNYAIAQMFGFSRAPNRYEQRGEAMAADLTDGITPDKVRQYREKILRLSKSQNIFEQVSSRMEEAYGPVMIGYGPPLSESKEGRFFLIGPDRQFQSLEDHIRNTEGEYPVYRLYPRDFWLTS